MSISISIGLKLGKNNDALIRYLIRDNCNTAAAAGSVDGTDADPGPGARSVTDSENKLKIDSS